MRWIYCARGVSVFLCAWVMGVHVKWNCHILKTMDFTVCWPCEYTWTKRPHTKRIPFNPFSRTLEKRTYVRSIVLTFSVNGRCRCWWQKHAQTVQSPKLVHVQLPVLYLCWSGLTRDYTHNTCWCWRGECALGGDGASSGSTYYVWSQCWVINNVGEGTQHRRRHLDIKCPVRPPPPHCEYIANRPAAAARSQNAQNSTERLDIFNNRLVR